jgi:succinoglycan biosynthesis transport protein ExoP
MDLRQYARLLRAHWLLILLAVVVCTSAAGYLAWTRTPIYSAQTQLFVSTGGVPSDPSQTYQGALFSQQRMLSYAQIVSSPAVATAVITQLGLTTSVGQLQAEIHASVPAGTVLINVTVKDALPKRARAIANAVGKQFSRFVNTLERPRRDSRSPVKVSVTSPASLPTSPIAPRKPFYLVLGALLGLVLGVGGSVLSELLNNRIRGGTDAAATAGAPVLGMIGEDPGAWTRPLVMVNDPSSFRAEAYRRLRTNLSAVSLDRGLRSFVVTSAVSSEGKTLITANLGITFAEAGYRVVLLDADLRRPKLADVMGVSSSVGLTDVLVDDLPVESALQTWRHGLPLEVLGGGRQPPNPSELLSSRGFATVLDALTNRAELVIVDAPPLLPVTDAAILAQATSGVIVVTRVGSTRTYQLEAAAQDVYAAGAHVLGVVLNRVPSDRAERLRSFGYASDPDLGAQLRAPSEWPPHVPAAGGGYTRQRRHAET